MVAPWYERIIDFFFVDLINIFCYFGELLFMTPRDYVPLLPNIEIWGFNFTNTPLIGYMSAYIIYIFIAIRIVRLVVGDII